MSRRPVWALHVLIVGLALHNLVMALLWRAGVRGGALTVVSAWKDVLLLVALALVVRRIRLGSTRVDWLALAFGVLIVLYGLLPQSWLGGGATHKGVLYAARHDLLPVGAYFLGRGLDLTARERAGLCRTVLATAAFVALFGLVDVYAVPLSFWRHSSGWFSRSSGSPITVSRGCPRTSSTTQGTASSTGGSPRPSSHRSRRATSSSSRSSSSRCDEGGDRRSRSCSSPRSSGRTRAPRCSRSSSR